MEVGINDYCEPEHFRQICEDDYNVSRTSESENNSMHHIHNSCEILICEEGSSDYFICNERYRIEKGDVLVIEAMHHHARAIREFPYLRYGLTVMPSYYRSFIFDLNLMKVFETLSPAEYEKRCKNLPTETLKELISSIQALYSESKSVNPMKQIMERMIITKIAVILYRAFHYEELDEISDPYQCERMQKIRDYINIHYAEPLSLNALSDIFYMHPSNISKYFHKYCGFTLNQYINTKRVSEAQKLIEGTSLSISMIAENTGFGSTNNFIRRYKEIIGKSPLQYRKEYARFIERNKNNKKNNLTIQP